MNRATPDLIWWTPAEIAAASLPDLPTTKRRVNALIERQGWQRDSDHARRRKGRGGGWEYHWRLFPAAAQKVLLAAAERHAEKAPRFESRDAAWTWFDGLQTKVREKAEARLKAIQSAEALEQGGMSRDLAVKQAASLHQVGVRSMWNWRQLIDGVAVEDRLPHLADRRAPSGEKKECSAEFWEHLKSDYLRLEQPSFTSCYRRAARVARAEGWATLPERTMRRRLEAEIDQLTSTLCRKGVEALKRLYPAQTRDRTAMVAMEAVNADAHRFDVFVRWPADVAGGREQIVRPHLIAFQDIYSGRILSWRLDVAPNKVAVGLALGDMVETFGIPEHVLLDNGREFANKYLTGQVPTRYRFKVRDDDIPGILKVLGCQVHWATPYSGQSKPIERAFRDLCDTVAKDPRFAGAYTGNRPDAKPENWGSRSIPLDRFLEVVAEGIEEHNAREGRRSQTARNRSFIQTFEDSYAAHPVRKATDAQRRVWLMGAEGVRADKTGLIRFMGNEYWSPWMHGIAEARVVVRFDPANLYAGLHIYRLDGGYDGLAECKVKQGFFDLGEARAHAAARRSWLKAEKAAAEAHRTLTAAELGAALDAAMPPTPVPMPVEAKVVRMVPNRPAQSKRPKRDPQSEAAHEAFIADFTARKNSREGRPEDERDRFRRAMELCERTEAGDALTASEERWLRSYRTTPEYAAQKTLLDRFGRDMLG